MSADTLTPDGAVATIGPAAADEFGNPSTFLGYAAVPGSDEIVTLSLSSTNSRGQGQFLVANGYDLSGGVLFRTVLADNFNGTPTGFTGAHPTLLANGDVVFAWNVVNGLSLAGESTNEYTLLTPAGGVVSAIDLPVDHGTDQYGDYNVPIMRPATVYATATGFNMEWDEQSQVSAHTRYGYAFDYFGFDGGFGNRVVAPESYANQITPVAHGFAGTVSASLTLADNTAQYWDGRALHDPVAIPGEPTRAITEEAAAMLTGGQAAVAWVDSGTDYVALFDPVTESFGARIGLDWGGTSDVHVAVLPDGGFAVSWMNGGAFKGEVFDATGAGGGIIALAGDVAGVTSHGELYTVALDSSGKYAVQTYAINSGSSGGGGSTVHTSDPNYTAPAGVDTIYLTGSSQTVHANNAGDTIFSNDTGNALYGGTGNDTIHMGRGGDWAAGGAGGDTFAFDGIPWAAGGIVDFGFGGDTLELGGLLATTQDVPAGGFSDGYLKLTDDGFGDTQVWARYATSGSGSDWLPVTTLYRITTANLNAHHTIVTVAPNGGTATTSASDYVAPSYVTDIALTGSQQHIDASATARVTIFSNDTGNVLIGGAGSDTFHLGRGGDWVAGGAGADTFAYAAIPWAAGGITDFNGVEGDRIDVTGLLSQAGYTGSDPFTDGYLKYATDGSGNAQLWAEYGPTDAHGWWLVATLDGVSTSSLHYSGGLIT